MRKLLNSFKRQKTLTFVNISLMLLVLLSISPVAASVNNWDFSPKNPVSGEIVNIDGSASPEEKVDISVNFEKAIPVSDGKFEYVLKDVNIPEGLDNIFTVEAVGAQKLNVRVKMVLWVAKSSTASGDTATVSQRNVPPGTYEIKIDGDAGDGVSQVNLKISASMGIKADSSGKFSYLYNTKSVPSGNFEINVGGIIKEVNVQSEEYSGSTQGSTSNSSSGSTSNSSSGSTSNSTSGSTSNSSSGSTSNSSSGSTSGSGSGSGSGSTSGSSSDSTSGSGSGSTSGSSSGSTSASSNGSSSSEKANSSIEPGVSKTLENKGVSGTTNLDNNQETEDTQKKFSEGNGVTASGSSPKPFVNIFYLVIGIGAGILIIVMYLLKK